MVTFADLMSLLLTLFVLLLTFAEMEVIKYKAVSGSIRNAFGIAKEDKLKGVIELEGSKRRKAATNPDITREKNTSPEVVVDIKEAFNRHQEMAQEEKEKMEMKQLEDAIKQAIAKEIAGSGMTVDVTGDGVVIRFPSEIAFPSGSGDLSNQFRETLDKLGGVLAATEGQIVVSGHTDNVPLGGGGQYRTNWDLSAARAASVVHHFIDDERFDGDRFTIQGFGESRPIAANESMEGRAKNRRVELLVVRKSEKTTLAIPGQ
ncbi:putative Chemotaxis protein motB [Magnetospira sp. QH-2]|nr:putative Chemotaxis protein motB [Magnetospira sp. QH-2]